MTIYIAVVGECLGAFGEYDRDYPRPFGLLGG